MPCKDNESYHAYKKWEEEWNEYLRGLANCHRFVVLVEEVLDIHLERVQNMRVIGQKWLNQMEYPNKDEVAHIAKRTIVQEDKLDHLDDLVYMIGKNWSLTMKSITTLKGVMDEMRLVLEEQLKNKKTGLDQLKEELDEVKSLFL
ncbi:hypothetical protein [Bacillus seohaeanensis]|jgi:hypothetical protein|uniref:Polyhydroxyalkanoic acid synthase, PhaR subunit n=1 Tax=Bacillus seohaeanensis TaxID=284580 RepID=A0ABW5RNT2_9BACI